MSIKSKTSIQEKLAAVEEYVTGEKSSREVAEELGVDKSTFLWWLNQYKQKGILGLQGVKSPKVYSQQLKQSAIESYQNGEGSLREICIRYDIADSCVLRDWLIQATQLHPRKSKSYSKEEKKAAVKDHLENGLTIMQVINKYNIKNRSVVAYPVTVCTTMYMLPL